MNFFPEFIGLTLAVHKKKFFLIFLFFLLILIAVPLTVFLIPSPYSVLFQRNNLLLNDACVNKKTLEDSQNVEDEVSSDHFKAEADSICDGTKKKKPATNELLVTNLLRPKPFSLNSLLASSANTKATQDASLPSGHTENLLQTLNYIIVVLAKQKKVLEELKQENAPKINTQKEKVFLDTSTQILVTIEKNLQRIEKRKRSRKKGCQ